MSSTRFQTPRALAPAGASAMRPAPPRHAPVRRGLLERLEWVVSVVLVSAAVGALALKERLAHASR